MPGKRRRSSKNVEALTFHFRGRFVYLAPILKLSKWGSYSVCSGSTEQRLHCPSFSPRRQTDIYTAGIDTWNRKQRYVVVYTCFNFFFLLLFARAASHHVSFLFSERLFQAVVIYQNTCEQENEGSRALSLLPSLRKETSTECVFLRIRYPFSFQDSAVRLGRTHN